MRSIDVPVERPVRLVSAGDGVENTLNFVLRLLLVWALAKHFIVECVALVIWPNVMQTLAEVACG
jgi:hypothetical protein